jgi:hypothetical protein
MAHDIACRIFEMTKEDESGYYDIKYGIEVEDQANSTFEECHFQVGKHGEKYVFVDKNKKVFVESTCDIKSFVYDVVKEFVNHVVAWTEGCDRPFIYCNDFVKVKRHGQQLFDSNDTTSLTPIFNKYASDTTMKKKGIEQIFQRLWAIIEFCLKLK